MARRNNNSTPKLPKSVDQGWAAIIAAIIGGIFLIAITAITFVKPNGGDSVSATQTVEARQSALQTPISSAITTSSTATSVSAVAVLTPTTTLLVLSTSDLPIVSPMPRLTYEGYLVKGQDCVKTQDYSCALESFNAAIKINPNNWGGYWWRGYLYRSDGNYDGAIDDFNKAISLLGGVGPNVAGSYYYLGLIYVEGKHDYQQSIENFTKSIRADNTYSSSYCQRALVYEIQQQTEKAIKDFRDCLKFIQPDDKSNKDTANRGILRLGGQP